ncbi:MAG: sugar phosphate isomerase/epimerase, partial [Acidobacteria bacterium]|nr:sugar phosphate isomerase/epimerase [Acidobacteriota bacterium]
MPNLVGPLRLAVCNEVFEKADFGASCRLLKKAGWQGIEIAPFTLAESVAAISLVRRRELRAIMAFEGVDFVGLHWLMVSPPGLHVTTPDAALRRKSWEYVVDLIDLCADLGP